LRQVDVLRTNRRVILQAYNEVGMVEQGNLFGGRSMVLCGYFKPRSSKNLNRKYLPKEAHVDLSTLEVMFKNIIKQDF